MRSIPLNFIILLPLLGATLNGLYALAGAVTKRAVARGWVNLIGVGLPLLAFGIALYLSWPFFHGEERTLVEPLFNWMSVGPFQVEAALALDRLSVVMCLVVTGVGFLIHLYSTGYMHDDPGYARYFAYLNLFLASMLILVLA